ncbi:MAG: hypothetical protein IH795_07905 [Bacteroidetes bacterium]|nr:hypothetical protein [Bacteroidota bacterium]
MWNYFLIIIFNLPLFSSSLMASPSDTREDGFLYLHADSLDKNLGVLELSGKWKFHPGDDILWADPNLDDSEWEITTILHGRGLTAEDLIKKVGWYRLHIEIDSSLSGIKLGLAEVYIGSIDVYFDGEIVFSSKYLNQNDNIDGSDILLLPHVTPLTIKEANKHVLSVRYTIHEPSFRGGEFTPFIFKLLIGEWKSLTALHRNELKSVSGDMNLFTGIFSAFALIHLLLYFFYPKARANLYYAINVGFMAMLMYFQFQIDFSTSAEQFLFYNSLANFAAGGLFVSGIKFVYTLFNKLAPKWNRPIVYGSAVLIPFGYFLPLNYKFVFALVFLAEQLRMIIYAIIKKISGSWILAVGVILFVVITSYQILEAMGAVPIIISTDRGYPYGFFCLIVSMSFYLARQIAQTNKDLERQVIQVQELSDKTIEQEREKLLLQSENEQKEMKLVEAAKREKVMLELEKSHEDLKDTQSQLVQSEKMASLGSLVAGVAHEINNPIGAVVGMHDTSIRAFDKLKNIVSKFLSKDQQNDPEIHKTIKVIDDANEVINLGTSRISEIVKRLKSFARLDEAELQRANINECIEETVKLFQHQLKEKVELVKELGDIPQVLCYPAKLNQVFLNLLINSNQAIDGKGEISIDTFTEDDNICITIIDNGEGIPENSLDKIFDPGFTTKGVGVGTGLGLSISYRIIQEHKGDISVESKEGEGSTFKITIPIDLMSKLKGT